MSSKEVIPIGIGVGLGVLSGGLGAAVMGGSVLLGSAVGGAMGGLASGVGVLLTPSAPGGPAPSHSPLITSSIRNIPVPVVFGVARLSGNYIAMGQFWNHKDGLDGTPGVRVQVMHAYIGLCEGPVQAVWGFEIDGKTIAEQVKATELDAATNFNIKGYLGSDSQGLPPYLASAKSRKSYGFTMSDPLPWHNTAYLQCGVEVGATPRFAQITCMVKGPDLSIWRKGKTGDTNQHDIPAAFHYDGYTQCYYTTLGTSDRAAPYGLLRLPRQRGPAIHTPPPQTVTANIAKGWYLGKHDVLLMQDPADPATFHLGHWGIARDSADWEKVTPDPGYASVILFEQLDELNACLHTIHQGAAALYIMRWNLLTGWITRIDLDIANTALTGFTFGPDANAYILATADNRLIFLDAATGRHYHISTVVPTANLKGLCVAGSLVGLLFVGGCIYYNPVTRQAQRRYGSTDTALAAGTLGGIGRAVQNTWTGHVSFNKAATFISFMATIPAVRIVKVDKRIPHATKVSTYVGGRLTTTTQTSYQTKSVKEDHTNYVGGWVRDWSYRSFDHYRLHVLEGVGSVAAALWNVMADEPQNATARWGAGLSPKYFCLSSFEALHAYCVGPVSYPYKNVSRYMERYRFDFSLDAERSVADFVANEILLSINGYRTLIDGQLHVGVQRTALAAAAHFTTDQIVQESASVAFMGRAAGANRVRVEFPNADDNYVRTFGEGNDEYDQNARGRVVAVTLNPSGVTRMGQARALSQQLIDAISSNRRQITFKTHWQGFMLSPGDGIEVTDPKLGLDHFLCRVTRLTENENGEIELTAIEHQPVRDLLVPGTTVEDVDADCTLLALSAEYRHNLCMTPMHAAVYEDSTNPTLVPMAALSPNTRLGKQIRVDYRFEDQSQWISLGQLDSAYGGFLAKNLSATAKGVVIDGEHGVAEPKIEGDLPVMIASHQALGIQTARATGDEAALATSYVPVNQSFGLRRAEAQAWNASTVTIQYAYRVSGIVEDDGCFGPALYLQGLNVCTEEPQDVFIALDQASGEFPFAFHVDSLDEVFVVMNPTGATQAPGTVYSDWQAVNAAAANCDYGCGLEVVLESGIDTISADVRLRPLGKFRDRDRTQGLEVLGNQTIAVELWDAVDSFFYGRATLVYPIVNGALVPFDNGWTHLDSRNGKPNWHLTRATLDLKHGDRLTFRWEVWNAWDNNLTTRCFGPVDLTDLNGGTHTTALPTGAWYQCNPASYEYAINFTIAGTVWTGADPDINNGSWWFYGTAVGGSNWWFNATNNTGWHLAVVGDGSYAKPRYWVIWHDSLGGGCQYRLVGSEAACSPIGVWTLTPDNTSGCAGVDMSAAVITITPGDN